jgi:hypothetical protein
VPSDARNLLRQWVFLKHRLCCRCHHCVFLALPTMIKRVFPGLRLSKRASVCRISLFRHVMLARETRKHCYRSMRSSKQQRIQTRSSGRIALLYLKTYPTKTRKQVLDQRFVYSNQLLLPVPVRLLIFEARCQRTHDHLLQKPKQPRNTKAKRKRTILGTRCIFTACASPITCVQARCCRGSNLLMRQNCHLLRDHTVIVLCPNRVEFPI